MKLIFLGPPGAGKGTQAERVAQKYAIPQISTGEILRKAIKDGTPTGLKARAFVESGALVPDDVVLQIVYERLAEKDCANGYLLDGFPRSLPQAEALDQLVDIDAVIDLEVPFDVIIQRLSGRRTCPACGHTTHITQAPSGLCPKCGATLICRKDDAPEAIKTRLVTYDAQTKPLAAHYAQKGKLHTLDGNQDLDAVTTALFTLLGSLQA